MPKSKSPDARRLATATLSQNVIANCELRIGLTPEFFLDKPITAWFIYLPNPGKGEL